MIFTDHNGTERRLVFTTPNLQRFEDRSGVELFKALFLATEQATQGAALGKVIARTSHITALLYECGIPLGDDRVKLPYSEFCEKITPAKLFKLAGDAIGELFDSFGMGDDDKKEDAEPAAGNAGSSPGETSSTS